MSKATDSYAEALAKGAGYQSYAELATKVRIDRAQDAYDRKEAAYDRKYGR